MYWKKFFKPSKSKVILTISLIWLYFWFINYMQASSLRMLATLNPLVYADMEYNLHLPGHWIITIFVYALFPIFYYYTFSCTLSWAFRWIAYRFIDDDNEGKKEFSKANTFGMRIVAIALLLFYMAMLLIDSRVGACTSACWEDYGACEEACVFETYDENAICETDCYSSYIDCRNPCK